MAQDALPDGADVAESLNRIFLAMSSRLSRCDAPKPTPDAPKPATVLYRPMQVALDDDEDGDEDDSDDDSGGGDCGRVVFLNRASLAKSSGAPLVEPADPTTAASETATADHRPTQAALDGGEEAASKDRGAEPNAAVVGHHTPPDTDSAAYIIKQDRELRNRMLGSRAREIMAERARLLRLKQKKKWVQDSDDDDDELGRSALGKRKRPRRAPKAAEEEQEEVKQKDVEMQSATAEQTTQPEMAQSETTELDTTQPEAQPETQPETTTTTKKRKRNKKKKNKNKDKDTA